MSVFSVCFYVIVFFCMFLCDCLCLCAFVCDYVMFLCLLCMCLVAYVHLKKYVPVFVCAHVWMCAHA